MSRHSDAELARLADLRIRYLRGDLHEQTLDACRLGFGRWLKLHGHIDEGGPGDPEAAVPPRLRAAGETYRGWAWSRRRVVEGNVEPGE